MQSLLIKLIMIKHQVTSTYLITITHPIIIGLAAFIVLHTHPANMSVSMLHMLVVAFFAGP